MSRDTGRLIRALQEKGCSALEAEMAGCILAVDGLDEALAYMQEAALPSPEAAFEYWLHEEEVKGGDSGGAVRRKHD